MDGPLSAIEPTLAMTDTSVPPIPVSPALLKSLHEIPIPERPKEPTDWVQLILFSVVFDTACLFIHISQLFLLPLSYLPYPWAKKYYEDAQRYIKGSFGILLGTSPAWHSSLRI